MLGFNPGTLEHLIQAKKLQYFMLDERKRFWRSDIEDLKRNKGRVSNIIKKHKKLEAAASVSPTGVTTDQAKQIKKGPPQGEDRAAGHKVNP
ncbi:MAG: hypothetical protein RQM92_15060 [Candidatus Syntrophopropionicum ammoniitolerans]